MKTVTLRMEIPANRELHVVLPDDVPSGPAEIVLVIGAPAEPATEPKRIRTLGDLITSGFAGSWRDRTDIADSVAFARKLREEASSPRYQLYDDEQTGGAAPSDADAD